jgi:hypothetical protein
MKKVGVWVILRDLTAKYLDGRRKKRIGYKGNPGKKTGQWSN